MESASTQTSRAQSPLYKDRATSPIKTFERKKSVEDKILDFLVFLVCVVVFIVICSTEYRRNQIQKRAREQRLFEMIYRTLREHGYRI